MKNFEFNYYKHFKCIGKSCKHNCCIGWKIDIDKKSLNNYYGLIKNDNRFNQDCFKNGSLNLKNERCPFLDQDNLCYIIKQYGEKALCKTCKTHPRFKSFFFNSREMGLGLYCENAARIILSQKCKMKLELVKDTLNSSPIPKFERKLFAFRRKVISIIQNRKLSISDRVSLLYQLADINLDKNSFPKWLEIFNELEALKINEFSFAKIDVATSFAPIVENFDREYEQLLAYLAFRHISRAFDLLDLRVRLGFVILSFKMINHIFATSGNLSFENLIETCRFYSSEIETSDDNIFSLLNQIESLVCII